MTIYGGIGGVEYPLLSHVPIDAGIGKCFPGGHAAGGFAWIALYFAAIQQGYRRAWCYAIFGVLLGMLMGYTQMMRGAHFMSHNLWTLWWTWFVQLVVFSLWYAPAKEETNANG
jgi:membrane-associated PAP2 superfamily phosphatase